MVEAELRAATEKSLTRMQKFDPQQLVREGELGTALNFREAVSPAKRLVDLYHRLSLEALQDFPEDKLNQVQSVANQDYNILSQILAFTADQQSPHAVRQSLIQNLVNAYPQTFNTLHPLIAYSLHRSADFQALDRQARGTLQQVRDEASELTEELKKRLNDANSVVADVRRVAAEAGVSQQAIYFQQEADGHSTEAEAWRKRTVWLAWGLGLYAVLSVLVAKIPWLSPDNAYQSVQLAISKILVFAVISFMLYLSARNFLSNRHNAIVNKHRQNALMTYKALVDAAGVPERSDVVLTHASACIFSPQPTAFSGDGAGDMPKATSIVEVLSKPIAGAAGH
jgi:hypothetical protein